MIDIGAPYELEFPEGKANLTCGPMSKEQAVTRFFTSRKKDNLPVRGLYFDLDVYRPLGEGEKSLKAEQIKEIAKTFARFGWEGHENVRRLVMG